MLKQSGSLMSGEGELGQALTKDASAMLMIRKGVPRANATPKLGMAVKLLLISVPQGRQTGSFCQMEIN